MNRKELIALPVYERSDVMKSKIRELRQEEIDTAILIVDDGSEDDTGSQIETDDLLHLLTHEKPLGYGACIVSAIEYAIAHQFTHIMFLDIVYPEFTAPVHLMRQAFEAEFDIVNISRASAFQSDDEYHSFNTSTQVSDKLRDLLGKNYGDFFSPFKGVDIQSLEKLQIEEFDEALLIQLWIQAAHFLLNTTEISCPEIALEAVDDTLSLEKDPEHYLNFIDGEILLYPLENR